MQCSNQTAATKRDMGNRRKWSPSGAPAAGDSVIIPNGKTMNIGANTSVASIYVATGGAITFSGKQIINDDSVTNCEWDIYDEQYQYIFCIRKKFTLGAGSSFYKDLKNQQYGKCNTFYQWCRKLLCHFQSLLLMNGMITLFRSVL